MTAENREVHKLVHGGRGGAGNVGPVSPSLKPVDLETPTIKQHLYTTGRGGSGNIVSNDNPDNARKAQDVEAPPELHGKDGDKDGYLSSGRGGAANMVKKVKDAVTGESWIDREKTPEQSPV